MTKTLPVICKSQDCKDQLRNYEYSYDQLYLHGQKLYEVYSCPVCHRQEGANFTEYYSRIISEMMMEEAK
jgi:hypothetical protein